MNRGKKIAILVCAFLTALNIVACGQAKGDEVVNTDESPTRQQESSVQTVEGADSDIKEEETANADESSVNQQESSMQIDESTNLETEEDKTIGVEESNAQTGENIGTEMTTEELLDLFINGSISAIRSEDSAFYITDLDMDSGEWDSYSIGERVDLDNDGENELIICGPYGGIYLDARNNRVYEFAVGEGDALVLSYVVYNGSTWIMYSNRMHTGYEAYHMEKFEGADNLVAELNFYEELVDEDNVEGKEKYTLNGTEISYDEYFELCSKIFAAEINTGQTQVTEQAEKEDVSGIYTDKQGTSDVYSQMTLALQLDGTYTAEISVYRVGELEGTAVWEGDALRFTSEEPYVLADISVTKGKAEVVFITGAVGFQTGDVYSFPDGAPDESAEGQAGDAGFQSSLSDEIATEISYAEEREKEIEKKQKEAVTQMDMNITAAEMHQLWDDTLNIVWGLLEANLNEADMEVLRKEEREWIAFKDAEVQAAGQECEGGSIQPSVEATRAADLTKARVYELAEYTK